MSVCEVSRYAYLLWFPEHHSTGGLWAVLGIANDYVIDVAKSSERTSALVVTLPGSELRCILDCISDRWGFRTKFAQKDSGGHTKGQTLMIQERQWNCCSPWRCHKSLCKPHTPSFLQRNKYMSFIARSSTRPRRPSTRE